ncbi:unnamed protein product [Acidithrix sp. C25]|nr:unnamed protein product [Acidithrix sp. C25]
MIQDRRGTVSDAMKNSGQTIKKKKKVAYLVGIFAVFMLVSQVIISDTVTSKIANDAQNVLKARPTVSPNLGPMSFSTTN